ncbi:hypothetical protein JTB14_009653 [Gonioctena quinquepunctata]|nr:hypothetical protein JTB14_009653 [Gonioctena quinquepunctata]
MGNHNKKASDWLYSQLKVEFSPPILWCQMVDGLLAVINNMSYQVYEDDIVSSAINIRHLKKGDAMGGQLLLLCEIKKSLENRHLAKYLKFILDSEKTRATIWACRNAFENPWALSSKNFLLLFCF